MQETWVQSLGWEDALEKDLATHSSTLAWKIPWMWSMVGYSPWGHKESDMTERLHLMLYHDHHYALVDHFHHPKEHCISIKHLFLFLLALAPTNPLQSLATTNLLSVFMDFPILDILCN